jgi:hypothetical protein
MLGVFGAIGHKHHGHGASDQTCTHGADELDAVWLKLSARGVPCSGVFGPFGSSTTGTAQNRLATYALLRLAVSSTREVSPLGYLRSATAAASITREGVPLFFGHLRVATACREHYTWGEPVGYLRRAVSISREVSLLATHAVLRLAVGSARKVSLWLPTLCCGVPRAPRVGEPFGYLRSATARRELRA